MTKYFPGDAIRVLDDEHEIQIIQQKHGGWQTAMKKSLGQEGIVREVYGDGYVKVEVGDSIWTLNPLCLQLLGDMDECYVSYYFGRKNNGCS